MAKPLQMPVKDATPNPEPQLKVRLRLQKLMVQPFFILVDEEGNIIDETPAQPFPMYPAKFKEFKALCIELEAEANLAKNKLDIDKLLNRPLF